MKKPRILEYLGTLAKLKRNFAADMADAVEKPQDKKYFEGRASAFDDMVREISTFEGELVDHYLAAPPDEFQRRDLRPERHGEASTH